MKNSKGGFTLIELLVVIAIIGILSTLAVVALNSARQRARDAKRVSDIKQIQTALEVGYAAHDNMPLNAAVLGSATASTLCQDTTVSPTIQTWEPNVAACGTGNIYMGLVPANPIPNGTDYLYYPGVSAHDYQITFTLEGDTGQLQAGPNCANQDGIMAGTAC